MKNQLFFVLVSIFIGTMYAKELTIGWDHWPPYQYKNKQGELMGIDIDIIKSVCEAVGYEVKFKQLPWKRLLIYLEDGRLDVGMAGSKTKERKKFINFGISYRSGKEVLFVRKGEVAKYKIKKLADLKKYNFRMGCTRGNYHGEEFKELLDKKILETEAVNDEIQNINKLIFERIDGFVGNEISNLIKLQKKEFKDKIEIHPYIVNEDKNYFMLSKKSTTNEDIEKLNEGIRLIKNNGEYDKIIKKYMRNN